VRVRRHLLSEHDEPKEIWPAFTDVMSTLALILFVLVLLSYVRSLISSKQLDLLHQQIGLSEQRLQRVEADLRHTGAEVQASQASLQASLGRLHDQEQTIASSNQQLTLLRAQLQDIAVLRVDVLNKLKAAIEAELGPRTAGGAALVTIGDNGNVVINESLVFESNSYAIKDEARPLLNGLAKALGKLLADASVRENIDAIVIQGHTDSRGAAAFNWELSAKRATAVLEYLFEANKVLANSYGRYFAASAFSKFRPIDTAETPSAYQQNRRIEISVVPKDANVRKVIDDYMQSAPGATPPSSAAPP
jgi:chemotaxis protein MotB